MRIKGSLKDYYGGLGENAEIELPEVKREDLKAGQTVLVKAKIEIPNTADGTMLDIGEGYTHVQIKDVIFILSDPKEKDKPNCAVCEKTKLARKMREFIEAFDLISE
jgi:hypothetical protein